MADSILSSTSSEPSADGDIVIRGARARRFMDAFYDLNNTNESLLSSTPLFPNCGPIEGGLNPATTVTAFGRLTESLVNTMLTILNGEDHIDDPMDPPTDVGVATQSDLQSRGAGGIDEATRVKIADKVDFAIKRLSELQHFCEQSWDKPSEEYMEHSHFIIGVCGHTIDQIYGLIGETRYGVFDSVPANVTMGISTP